MTKKKRKEDVSQGWELEVYLVYFGIYNTKMWI